VALSAIDPGTVLLMKVSSELMDARAVIRAQRKQILALAAALRTQQLGMASMADVIDTLLSGGDDA
jgi:hypothetical protein